MRKRVGLVMALIAFSGGDIVADARAEKKARGGGCDVSRALELYELCAACHVTSGGSTHTGPSLAGVVGRRAAALDDFSYSRALRQSGITWTEAQLDRWLQNPRQLVANSSMIFFQGVPSAEDRSALICYLKTLPARKVP